MMTRTSKINELFQHAVANGPPHGTQHRILIRSGLVYNTAQQALNHCKCKCAGILTRLTTAVLRQMEENLCVGEETERGVYSLGTGRGGLLPEPYRQQKALVKYRYILEGISSL